MKLATLKSSSRDGELIVISRDQKQALKVPHIAANLRTAVENWHETAPALRKVYEQLNQSSFPGSFTPNEAEFHSPLPRSFQWADGSAFVHHVKLVRMARKVPLPEKLFDVPLMYQGGSDDFLAPTD